MAILGNIIKGFIHMKDTLTPESNAIEAQEKVLTGLLEKAKDTAFGRAYKFTEILSSDNISETFAKRVPYFDYDTINKKWWQRLHKGEADVTWPGSAGYFSLSSGTTGKTSKRIPVTDDMIAAIRRAGLQQVFALSNFDLPSDFFEKEILMLSSTTDLVEKDGHTEGEISGISASNIPFWFKDYYKPGEDIAGINSWDDRIRKISEKAGEWDVGALSGIPSWVELMLQEIISRHKLNHIHEIWPNLRVFASGGIAFQPYEKSFNALMGKPITVIDTYLASEGFLAFQSRPGTRSMQLITDNGIYFEFVPFEPEYILEDGSLRQDVPALILSEVETGQEYVMLISTVAGAWRYLIGDTVRFTDTARAEIRLTGRTKFFLNTVGSQLSVNKMNDAIKELESEFGLKIPEFIVCAKRFEDGYYHSWYLGTEGKKDPEPMAASLDASLKEANKNYKVARSKALRGVKVRLVVPSVFHEWNARGREKGGQLKTENVMDEGKFAEWEQFVKDKEADAGNSGVI